MYHLHIALHSFLATSWATARKPWIDTSGATTTLSTTSCFPRAGRTRALCWPGGQEEKWCDHSPGWPPRNLTWWLSTERPTPSRWPWSSWLSPGTPLPTSELLSRGKPRGTMISRPQSREMLQPSSWNRHQRLHQPEEQELDHPPLKNDDS